MKRMKMKNCNVEIGAKSDQVVGSSRGNKPNNKKWIACVISIKEEWRAKKHPRASPLQFSRCDVPFSIDSYSQIDSQIEELHIEMKTKHEDGDEEATWRRRWRRWNYNSSLWIWSLRFEISLRRFLWFHRMFVKNLIKMKKVLGL
jgi:nitrate reductase gamma subunit